MQYDVFISYSSKDSATAQAICHELEDNHIRCWMAPRDIPVGSKYASVITEAIKSSKAVVLVFSERSAMSPWVESEINIAFSNRKPIIPYKIDKSHIEDFSEFYLMLNNRYWIEAYPDFKTRFAELVEVVSQVVKPQMEGREEDIQSEENVEQVQELLLESQNSPQPMAAILNVTSLPTGAIVCVDGEKIGITPIKDIEVSRGRHKLKVSKRGYQVRNFTRTFDDKPVVLNVELEKKVTTQSLENTPSTSIVTSSSITNTSTLKNNVHEYVDLGLSVKWATCNVGATTPEERGTIFAKGELSAKFLRLPTSKELRELRDRCTWTWTSQKGREGYFVTGPNGNNIFLPTTSRNEDLSSVGFYWSNNTAGGLHGDGRWCFCFDSLGITLLTEERNWISYPVRPVIRFDSRKGIASFVDRWPCDYKLYPNCELATKVNRCFTSVQKASIPVSLSISIVVLLGVILGVDICYFSSTIYIGMFAFLFLVFGPSNKLKNKLSDNIATKRRI